MLTYSETLQVVAYYGRTFLNKTSAESDTTVDSKKYVKYFEDNFTTANGYGSAKLAGMYRSLPTGQTYIRKYNKEYLLIDISKDTGDTIFDVYTNYCQNDTTTDCIVDSTGSIQVGPFKLRLLFLRQINDCPGYDFPLIWCEGNGCLAGGLTNRPCQIAIGDSYGLDCMSAYDTVFISSGHGCPIYLKGYNFPYSAGSCYFPVGLNTLADVETITWAMDQGTQSIKLMNLPPGLLKLQVFDSCGKELKNEESLVNGDLYVSLREFSPGLFFIRIYNQTQIALSIKIVKFD